LPYATAGKLIARANLDWLGNPDSGDVGERFMFEGAPSTLRLLNDCSPEVILPMDFKTFRVLHAVMREAGFLISERSVSDFSVCISDASERYHRSLHAFFATTPDGREMLVMKLPQHPARMFQPDYATRCGVALRGAATQLFAEHHTNTTSA
jgi:hypothetical protein